MKEVEYFELLRSSQDIVLREEIVKIKAKTRDYILSQIKLLENKYQQKIEELVYELQNLKQNYEQLQLKNQSYALIIQEQEYKSIQNKNFVTLEIVNQLLTQKIKQLLLKLRENNIISDQELQSQYHVVQRNISDVYKSNNDNQLCQIIQNQQQQLQQQLDNEKIESIQDNSKFMQGYNTNNQYLTEKISQASQTLKRDAQRIKSSTTQRKSENIQRMSLTPNVTKEIFDFKKSIDELKKSKNNLENCNEYLKQQNKTLQMKLSQKQSTQTNNQTFVSQQNPKIITKFLKFDDILFKKVQSFSMADSFDLKQKFPSNRTFSARPRTSIPSTCRNKQIPQHQAYQILL